MDKQIKNIAALLFIGIFAVGCMAKQIVYIPDSSSVNDPKTIIHRILEEQPGGHTPLEIEVKNDKIRVLASVRLSSTPFALGSVLKTFTIYYDNIGSVELYEVRDYYNILINGESGNVIYRVVTYDLDKAKSFMDALHAMMN